MRHVQKRATQLAGANSSQSIQLISPHTMIFLSCDHVGHLQGCNCL